MRFRVRGMALQPGAALTTGALTSAPQPFPPDKVRIALYYGINWGYTESDPQQAVLAVWYMQDSIWRGSNHRDAESIVSAAANAPGMPSWNPSGRSVLQLASAGQVSLSQITFTPSEGSQAIGSGMLTIANTSETALSVHLPYGAVFGTGSDATLVWAVGIDASEASPTAPPNATTTMIASPSATATSVVEQPTSTPRPVKGIPTATPVSELPTETAVPPQKSSPTTKPKSVLSPTATGTDTALPTSTATATSLPTGTATPLPSSTATDTATHTREATATFVATSTRVAPTVVVEKAQPSATKKSSPQPVETKGQSNAASKAEAVTAAATTPQANPAAGDSKVRGQEQSASNTNDNTSGGVDKTTAAEQSQAKKVLPSEQAPTIKGQVAEPQNAVVQAALPPGSVPTAVKQNASSVSAAPPPVGTAIGSPTTVAAGVPPAAQTILSTIAPKATGASGSATAISTPVLKVTISPTAAGNVGGSGSNGSPPAPVPSAQAGQLDVPPAVSTRGGVATVQAQPTKLVDIAPTPTAPSEPQPQSPPPPIIIDTNGDKAPSQTAGTALGTTDGQQPTVGNKGSADTTGNTGSAPNSSPRTGAGPSSVPMWLLLASGVLVLGGWKMRRLAEEVPQMSHAVVEA